METLKLLLPMALTYGVVLAAVVLVVRRMVLGDARRAVENIQQVEADVRKKEEAVRREIEEHEKDFARRKAEAEEDVRREKEKAEKEAMRLRDQVLGDAKKEGDRILDQARKNESKLRMQIAREMEDKAVDYGAQVFKLVFSEKIGEQLHAQFMDELLDALQEVDAANMTVDGQNASFTCSHPLSPAHRARLEKLLQEKFALTVQVQEKVEPSLLAGMILKLGNLEVDGSLLNRYREAAEEIKKTTQDSAAATVK